MQDFIQKEIEQIILLGRFRDIEESVRSDSVYITRDNKKYISFSCNDYFGLSQNQNVKQAAIAAIEKYGAGAGASRLITGNNPLYSELEGLLSQIKGTEKSLVFGSGYLANIGVIQALVGKGDLIIADKLVHASIIDGCLLSGAKLLRFKHNDILSCKKILQENRKLYRNCIVITETIFSMDGDLAPVEDLLSLAKDFNACLVTDDAHGLGVLNNKYTDKSHIQIGTLSKAVGSYGGYVCATKDVIVYLQNKARTLIYSTALPPSVVAASVEALKIISTNKDLCTKAVNNARLFTTLLDIKEAQSAIVPLILGGEEKVLAVSKALMQNGFVVAAIRPPTVPKNTARLRFTFSSMHKEDDIKQLVSILKHKLSIYG